MRENWITCPLSRGRLNCNFVAIRVKRLSILLPYTTKEQRRLIRDKRNGKEKLKEEKSLFLEFPRVTLTEIIATQPLSRDYATIVMRLSQLINEWNNWSVNEELKTTRVFAFNYPIQAISYPNWAFSYPIRAFNYPTQVFNYPMFCLRSTKFIEIIVSVWYVKSKLRTFLSWRLSMMLTHVSAEQ